MFNPISDIISAVGRGEMVVMTDDADRENEGDLVMAADAVTPEAINFMAMHGRGLICVPMTQERAYTLDLPEMARPADPFNTAFTVTVDVREGITTGISAHDRAATIRKLADVMSTRDDFIVPGHVFPLIAKPGGVLVRAGHTEAAVDLARLAGKNPMGVICEIMHEDGTMARVPQLQRFCRQHNFLFGAIADLIAFRRQAESLITLDRVVNMPTKFGLFKLHCFVAKTDEREHLALVFGDVKNRDNVLVRVHSECLTGDVFHSSRCDCGEQLEQAMKMVAREGAGVIVYMRQEGRGIGLRNKLHAYHLQDQGLDTVDANVRLGFAPDLREYGIGAQILLHFGLKNLRLLTNNPMKIVGLEGYGLKVSERVSIITDPNQANLKYLQTKKDRMGHII